MEGRITSDMEIIRPIRQGVIVDYTVTEKMLKYFISRAIGRRAFRKPRISICVPSGITEIEKRQWRKQPIRLVPEMSIWWRNL